MERGGEHPVVSQPGGWMESLPLCLPLYSLSLFPCCLTLAFTLASVYVCVCVCREGERETSFRAAGIYYNPNKRSRLIVYELPAFQANKGPYFHRKLHFHFSSIWLPEQRKIKRPLRSQRPKGIHSSFSRSFNSTEKVSLLLSFQDRRQMGF